MKLLVQRVLEASVEVNGKTVGKIGQGTVGLFGRRERRRIQTGRLSCQ